MGKKSIISGNEYDANKVGCVELDSLLCPMSDEDKDLVRQLSDALDVLSRREYGSDSPERVNLLFDGYLIEDRKSNDYTTKAYLSYNISALFPEDNPQLEFTRAFSSELDANYSEHEARNMLDSFNSYRDKINERAAIARSLAPIKESEGGVTQRVVDANEIKSIFNGLVAKTGGFELFQDRVIELGSGVDFDVGLGPDFIYRSLGFGVDHVKIYNATPVNGELNNFLSRPAKYYPADTDTDTEHEVYSGEQLYKPHSLLMVATRVVGSPVFESDAFERLIKGDLETGLDEVYYGLTGPAFGYKNKELDEIASKTGVKRLFIPSRTGDRTAKTDVVFKAGFDHLADGLPNLSEFLKELGCFNRIDGKPILFDQFPVSDWPEIKSGEYSEEAYEQWQKFTDSLVDVVRLSQVASRVIAHDKNALTAVVEGEIQRQWGAMLQNAGLDSETNRKEILRSIMDSIDSAVNRSGFNGVAYSNKNVDAVIFEGRNSSRRFRWSSSAVNTLESNDNRLDWQSEPRAALLDYAFSSSFSSKRGGHRLVIDLLSIVDPELAGRLYGIGKEHTVNAGPQEETAGAGYQDTGVVTGYAIKDLRAMSIETLMGITASMSSVQREKYVKRDLYFQRPKMEDLREAGCSPAVAAMIDQIWVALPPKPFTMLSNDVEHFGLAVNAAKEALEEVLENREQLNDLESFFSAYDESIKKQTGDMFDTRISRDRHDYKRKQHFTNKTLIKDIPIFGAFGFRDGYRDQSEMARRMFETRFTIKKGGQTLRAADIDWGNLLPEKAKSRASATTRKVTNPDIRTGEDYRKGKVLDNEDFIKTFGFSGVEFGNWTNQAEREAHINLSYDSMLDFCKLLECEPMALSLGGRLGLCFGSRGRGGKNPASAHYEPTNMAINLTRRAGAGSLAHEYFHAIAGHYGELDSGVKGADYSEKLGYMLAGSNGAAEDIPSNVSMRPELQESFFNLMKAIMYKPSAANAEVDISDISIYTKRSDMFVASDRLDAETRSGKHYWSLPHELFARSMEVWVGAKLAEKGGRNDYLVSPHKMKLESELYPDAEHLERISHFAGKWVAALRTDMKQVQHPYLGETEMPIFHSKNRVRQPLNQHVLESFAVKELSALFGKVQPRLQLDDNAASASAGTYDFIKHLMTLNLAHANRDTFYHEAWHVCHSAMLSSDERCFLEGAFKLEAVQTLVLDAMRENGYTEDAIKDAASQPLELQAYAFELWVGGKVQFSEARTKGIFVDVKEVVQASADISDAFTLKGIETIFERFYGGEMALELEQGKVNNLSAGQAALDRYEATGEYQESVVYAPSPKAQFERMGM